jgi:hypothetical protein
VCLDPFIRPTPSCSGKEGLPRCSWDPLPGLRVTGRAGTTVSHLHARWSSRVTVAFLKVGFFRTISIFLTWKAEPPEPFYKGLESPGDTLSAPPPSRAQSPTSSLQGSRRFALYNCRALPSAPLRVFPSKQDLRPGRPGQPGLLLCQALEAPREREKGISGLSVGPAVSSCQQHQPRPGLRQRGRWLSGRKWGRWEVGVSCQGSSTEVEALGT